MARGSMVSAPVDGFFLDAVLANPHAFVAARAHDDCAQLVLDRAVLHAIDYEGSCVLQGLRAAGWDPGTFSMHVSNCPAGLVAYLCATTRTNAQRTLPEALELALAMGAPVSPEGGTTEDRTGLHYLASRIARLAGTGVSGASDACDVPASQMAAQLVRACELLLAAGAQCVRAYSHQGAAALLIKRLHSCEPGPRRMSDWGRGLIGRALGLIMPAHSPPEQEALAEQLINCTSAKDRQARPGTLVWLARWQIEHQHDSELAMRLARQVRDSRFVGCLEVVDHIERLVAAGQLARAAKAADSHGRRAGLGDAPLGCVPLGGKTGGVL